jgi:hypothetical protein
VRFDKRDLAKASAAAESFILGNISDSEFFI